MAAGSALHDHGLQGSCRASNLKALYRTLTIAKRMAMVVATTSIFGLVCLGAGQFSSHVGGILTKATSDSILGMGARTTGYVLEIFGSGALGISTGINVMITELCFTFLR